jgi:hypothetical protein
MTYLPARPDLEQLRHQAKDLLREATRGDAEALARIHAVSHRVILASAQLAIARDYGFESWPKLKREVERREVLNSVSYHSLPRTQTWRSAAWSTGPTTGSARVRSITSP